METGGDEKVGVRAPVSSWDTYECEFILLLPGQVAAIADTTGADYFVDLFGSITLVRADGGF